MDPISPSKPNWFGRARRAFRKRWVWVCIVGLVWLLVVAVSVSRFMPKKSAPGADAGKYKFMHCDQCKTELPYNKDLDGKKCAKCQPPKTGYYVATEVSVKSGAGALSPWAKVYVAAFVETVVMLAAVTFLLYLPVPDPKTLYFVVACPYCSQRLRYRAISHGGLGSCSRCKRMLRFPAEADAVTEDEVLRADAAEAEADAERLRTEAEERAEQA